MYKGKKILAIVTARGGSKGLPGKNIKIMNGKPLIAWTLECAKKSKFLDYIFVSTDSQKIADVSEKCGVKVPELRPEYLAQDETSSMDVLEYTINRLENQGRVFDYMILLEPTSPLRKDDDIDKMIELAIDNPESDGVISVGQVHQEHPSIIKKINEDGYIKPYVDDLAPAYQRQQEDEAYFPYGVGYLVRILNFKKSHTIYMDRMRPYLIERWQNYEVDDIYDFMCIETIMKMEGRI